MSPFVRPDFPHSSESHTNVSSEALTDRPLTNKCILICPTFHLRPASLWLPYALRAALNVPARTPLFTQSTSGRYVAACHHGGWRASASSIAPLRRPGPASRYRPPENQPPQPRLAKACNAVLDCKALFLSFSFGLLPSAAGILACDLLDRRPSMSYSLLILTRHFEFAARGAQRSHSKTKSSAVDRFLQPSTCMNIFSLSAPKLNTSGTVASPRPLSSSSPIGTHT